MANAYYNPGKEGILSGEISWPNGTMRIAAVRGYTFSATHKFVSDVTGAGGTLAVTTEPLVGKTYTDGIARCASTMFAATAASASAHYLLLFQSSAAEGGADLDPSAQRLLLWVDDATGVPFTLDGADLPVFPGWFSGSAFFTL